MKASELRKGNLIFFPFHNEFVEVVGIPIKQDDDTEYVQVKTQGTILMEKLACFLPIEIDDYVLQKSGYSQCPIREKHLVRKGHAIRTLKDYMFLCDKNGVFIKSLHQLQNLYFSLNKQEIEYEH